MNNRLTLQQQEQIKKMLWSYAPKKTWMFDEVPAKQLANAKKIYGQLKQDQGEVILLHDTTFFGSGKSGFVLTSQALYINLFEGRPQIFILDDVDHIGYTEAKEGNLLSKITDGFTGSLVGGLVGGLVGDVVEEIADSFGGGEDAQIVVQLQSGKTFGTELEGESEDAFKLLIGTWQILSPESHQDAPDENAATNWKCEACGATNQKGETCEYCRFVRT